MSVVLLFHCLLLNMFRMLVHPSSGAISRKLLKMDVLTFETGCAVNSEIIKQVTTSWSIFIQQLNQVKMLIAFCNTYDFNIILPPTLTFPK
jgi:hypothetical protein